MGQAEVMPGHPDWRPSWAVLGRPTREHPADLVALAQQTARAAVGAQSAITRAGQALAEFSAGMREGFERASGGLQELRERLGLPKDR